MKIERTIEQLYEEIIGVEAPWMVTAVIKDEIARKIIVRIEYDREKILACPVCARSTKRYDHRVRVLRYLDTCQYQTVLEVHVPRIKCKKDGVQQITIPFAEKHSRFSYRFERAVLAWLQDSPISAVAKNLNLSWDEVDGIMQRGVRRGLERRAQREVRNLGIDETSFKKGHEYVTVVMDKDLGTVIEVISGHDAEGVKEWFRTQKSVDLREIRSITMDMWDAYIKAVRESLEGWERLIAFDRFHVAKYFTEGVDKVRRREHGKFLRDIGESPLTKSRFEWLVNSHRVDNRSGKRKAFLNLSRSNLETARAWRIKEAASELWDYLYMKVAEEAWKKLLKWISLCRIPEMIKVGKTVRNYFWGILNAIRLQATNGIVEATNNRIQRIKRMACGFRNRERFRIAILFHLGNLNMDFSTI
jgi:transposase